MGNLDKLRAYLGLVGGQPSFVMGQALKRLKQQDEEIERLNDQLTEQAENTEMLLDERSE